MTYGTSGASIASFRERSEKIATTMENATFYTFWCSDCDRSRPVKGRVSRGWKMGFRCACCHEEKTKAAAWKLAQKQADHVPEIKSEAVKDRQIVMLCETLKKAMRK